LLLAGYVEVKVEEEGVVPSRAAYSGDDNF
jgi:hypothetical protein